MKTPEGETYYRKWMKGEISCKMVRQRSGAGLLAKFFGKKVEEEEEEKMLQAALAAESQGGDGNAQKPDEEPEKPEVGQQGGEPTSSRTAGSEDNIVGAILPTASTTAPSDVTAGALPPPSSWPSYVLVPAAHTIHLDSQSDSQQQELGSAGPGQGLPCHADAMSEEEYNRYQLDFAIAAGDVPAIADDVAPTQESGDQGALDDAAGVEAEGPGGEGADTLTSSTESRMKRSDLRHWLT